MTDFDAHPPVWWSARRASLTRHRKPDDPELREARDACRYWRLRRVLDSEYANQGTAQRIAKILSGVPDDQEVP